MDLRWTENKEESRMFSWAERRTDGANRSAILGLVFCFSVSSFTVSLFADDDDLIYKEELKKAAPKVFIDYRRCDRDYIFIVFKEELAPTAVEDKWNFWIFNVGLSGSLSGEESTSEHSVRTNISANRVTPDMKLRLRLEGEFEEDRFDIDGSEIVSTSISMMLRKIVWASGAISPIGLSVGSIWTYSAVIPGSTTSWICPRAKLLLMRSCCADVSSLRITTTAYRSASATPSALFSAMSSTRASAAKKVPGALFQGESKNRPGVILTTPIKMHVVPH